MIERTNPAPGTAPQPPPPPESAVPVAAGVWPGWFGPLIWVGLGLSVLVALATFLSATERSGFELETVVVYLVLPLAIIASVAASRRFGARWVFVAAALLDVVAVLVSARAAIGLAFAVILPFAGTRMLVAVAPTAITLHTHEPDRGSARNQWTGRITGLELLTDRVRVAVDGYPPAAVDVTPAAVADLNLHSGQRVWLTAKATAVIAYPDPGLGG